MQYPDPKKVAPRTLFEAEARKAEKKYKRLLNGIMQRLKKLIAGITDFNAVQAVLMKFAATKTFQKLCRETARQVVTMLAVGQMQSWRAAASASSQGRRIFLALQKELKTTPIGVRVNQIIDQNARLIQTVPQSLANEFSRIAGETQFAGMRPEELLEEFKKRAPHLTDVQARRIARTETGKAATALVQARAESMELPLYTWLTSRDERVRDSHRLMNGVICSWNDPPNPELLAGEERTYGNYHPRGIFNCRCDALPIVDTADITFPAKVHFHGSIRTVKNIQELQGLFGIVIDEPPKRAKGKARNSA